MNAPFNPNNIPEQRLTPDYKDSLAETRLWLPLISVSHVLEGKAGTHGGLDASQWLEYLDNILDDEQKYMAYADYLRKQAMQNPLPCFADMVADKAVEADERLMDEGIQP